MKQSRFTATVAMGSVAPVSAPGRGLKLLMVHDIQVDAIGRPGVRTGARIETSRYKLRPPTGAGRPGVRTGARIETE